MTEFDGIAIRVQWDGSTLRVHGKTKMARMGLAGQEHDQGDVVLGRDEIADVRLKRPGLLTNGNLVLRTVEGRKYQLHFRRKHQADFQRLADELS